MNKNVKIIKNFYKDSSGGYVIFNYGYIYHLYTFPNTGHDFTERYKVSYYKSYYLIHGKYLISFSNDMINNINHL